MPSRPDLRLEPAVWPTDAESVRRLFRRYQAWLEVDLCFQDFAAELAGLPGQYAGPAGGVWLLRDGMGGAQGCVGLRPLDLPDSCELKRLWVEPPVRGDGWGRRLTETAIAHARAHGYQRIVLDTLDRLTAAIALYRDLGFREVPPYTAHPIPGTLCFGLPLGSDAGAAPPQVPETRGG